MAFTTVITAASVLNKVITGASVLNTVASVVGEWQNSTPSEVSEKT